MTATPIRVAHAGTGPPAGKRCAASWPIPTALLSMSDSFSHIHIQEIGVYDHYAVEPVIRGVMGFGQSPSYDAPLVGGGGFASFWGPLVRQLADRLHIELDDMSIISDHAVYTRTSRHRQVQWKRVRRSRGGSPAKLDRRAPGDHRRAHHLDGTARRPGVAAIRHGVGESNYRIVIDGSPNLRCDLDLGRNADVWGSVSATAMRMVNLIPAVVQASPGLLSALDLPLLPGRQLSPA